MIHIFVTKGVDDGSLINIVRDLDYVVVRDALYNINRYQELWLLSITNLEMSAFVLIA